MNNEIIEHENMVLKIYLDEIKQKYVSKFKEYGCDINVGLCWRTDMNKPVSYTREHFQDGYMCILYIEIQKNGKVVEIESHDGEVDYYSLSIGSIVSHIYVGFLDRVLSCFNKPKLRLSLCSPEVDADDIEDLELFLKILSGKSIL